MGRRGIFVDRDGVLCRGASSYVKSWEEFHWLAGALDGLLVLYPVGLPVIVVTNQSAVNRRLTTASEVADIHARMRAAVQEHGGRLDAVYFCPHRPDEGCQCRKPGQSLFRKAAEEWGIGLTGSYIVGDSRADLEAGWELNMKIILVRTGLGRETEANLGERRTNLVVVTDFLEAARWIRTRELDGALPTVGRHVWPSASSLNSASGEKVPVVRARKGVR